MVKQSETNGQTIGNQWINGSTIGNQWINWVSIGPLMVNQSGQPIGSTTNRVNNQSESHAPHANNQKMYPPNIKYLKKIELSFKPVIIQATNVQLVFKDPYHVPCIHSPQVACKRQRCVGNSDLHHYDTRAHICRPVRNARQVDLNRHCRNVRTRKN